MPSRPEPLHLFIDPIPPCHPNSSSPDDSGGSSSYSSGQGDSLYSKEEDFTVICSVLCQHDFSTSDPDQLSFKRNEILDVVTKEDNGWWAAMRPGGDRIGWIPSAFVTVVTQDIIHRLNSIAEPLRGFEYQAERLWETAPVSQFPAPFHSSSKIQSPAEHLDTWEFSPLPAAHPKLGAPPPSPRGPGPTRGRCDKPTPPTPIPNPDDDGIPPTRSPKIDRVMGGHASEVVKMVQEQANLPWFLQPAYGHQLEINDGNVRSGTLNALVEKLTSECIVKDPIKLNEAEHFRNIFLTTFRTFTKPEKLFACLVDRYRIRCPPDLLPADFEEWKERKQFPTQRQVLAVLSSWLERHGLLEEEPFITKRLTEFLGTIQNPQHQIKAAEIIQAIDRITFAETHPPTSTAVVTSPLRVRGRRSQTNNVMKFDATELARELSLMQHSSYVKIRPQEVLNRVDSPEGPAVENLQKFCESWEKVVMWVKVSVLLNDTLSDRANTISHWIKVAEKCRGLNNFFSMSAITTGLTSGDIHRLHLTWAHVNRPKSTLESLQRYMDPTGGFSNMRALINVAEGPGVPFVVMLFTDLLHVNELKDSVLIRPSGSSSSVSLGTGMGMSMNGSGGSMSSSSLPSTNSPVSNAVSPPQSQSSQQSQQQLVPQQQQQPPQDKLINFQKRQRWYDIIVFMLKFQSRPYEFLEKKETRMFIYNMFKQTSAYDKEWTYARSREIVQSEMAHADIRRGLEEAGF